MLLRVFSEYEVVVSHFPGRVMFCILGLHPHPHLQALDIPEQLGGILVKLHEVHRFTVASAFPLHHYLLLAWDAAVWRQV